MWSGIWYRIYNRSADKKVTAMFTAFPHCLLPSSASYAIYTLINKWDHWTRHVRVTFCTLAPENQAYSLNNLHIYKCIWTTSHFIIKYLYFSYPVCKSQHNINLRAPHIYSMQVGEKQVYPFHDVCALHCFMCCFFESNIIGNCLMYLMLKPHFLLVPLPAAAPPLSKSHSSMFHSSENRQGAKILSWMLSSHPFHRFPPLQTPLHLPGWSCVSHSEASCRVRPCSCLSEGNSVRLVLCFYGFSSTSCVCFETRFWPNGKQSESVEHIQLLSI